MWYAKYHHTYIYCKNTHRQSIINFLFHTQRPKISSGPPDQACYPQEIEFVVPSSLDKYRCIHCKGVPTTCYRSKCGQGAKDNKGLSCSDCKIKSCTSCVKVDYEPDTAASGNIRKLKVFCPNKKNGCEVKPTLAERDYHIKECKKIKIQCAYKQIGCEDMPLLEDKEKHEEDMKHFKLLFKAYTDLKERFDSSLPSSAVTEDIPGPIPTVGENEETTMAIK